MRCLAQEGQSSAVAAAFLRCRAMLTRHFGTEPSALTEKIYRDACQNRGAPGLPPPGIGAAAEYLSMS
jgi:hypothetical protein